MSWAYPTSSRFSAEMWQGIFWKLLSCACFAGINGVVRYLTKGEAETMLSASTVTFFQNVFGTLFLFPLIGSLGIKNLKTSHPYLHLIRVVTAVFGIVLWYEALKHMPIAQAMALNFTGPIFTVLAAWLMLSERVTWLRASAIVFSLAGAFVIFRPDIAFRSSDYQPMGLAVLYPIASALVIAFNKILTRRLALHQESPQTLAIYLMVFMTPVSAVFAYVHGFSIPSVPQLWWLVLAGGLAAMAHYSFAKAYQLAEVTFLMPFGFLKFFMSALVGYLAFNEFPDSLPMGMGMVLILISVVLLSAQEKRVLRPA